MKRALLCLALVACRATPDPDSIASTRTRAQRDDYVVVSGRRFPTEARVVRWDSGDGYDAYATSAGVGDEPPTGLRYLPGRRVRDTATGATVERKTIGFDELRETVDKFVLHYDVCGTSERCFHVLHDLRGLSVHFLLDVDGTVYQTLDLREQAWHARQANPTSIGIEIAQIGAYPPGRAGPLDEWYVEDADGVRLSPPGRWAGRIRTPGFIGRPAREERVRGEIQGELLEQHDFTPEQYDALVKLTRTLLDVFPNLRAEAPRDASGAVRSDVLTDTEFENFAGVLGHYHISADKVDPGPAFDWESFLDRVRAKR